ncbi:hypothetical protein AVEN_149741-1 [Araneus ventricosus]|uniref:Uncharacterized protein n=1 Tax=Araneus ventricosus TaxID=182803 RepID=A0A4Y2B1L1_ARAVE|nr:hypothetical protein AVEN_149741-1 [Araneus ventricosus]
MGKRKSGPFSGQQIATNTSKSNFPTFFIIKRASTSAETFHTVSPFLVEKAITATVGDVKSTKRFRSGDLLVEVQSRKQSEQIVKLKTFSNIPITVSPHASLNSSKGVITCGELLNVTTEEILKELQAEKISKFYPTSHREVRNPVPAKDNISTRQSVLKPLATPKPTSVDTELLPMAVLPPLEKALLQSRESDADAEMSSSSLSEEDALEYDMSEDLEDSLAGTSPPPSSKPEKADKYKNR